MNHRCTVCSLERGILDRNAVGGFSQHVKLEHNVWHYVFLMAYLERKEATELTGLESHVVECMGRKDPMGFLPIHRALAVQGQGPLGLSHDSAGGQAAGVEGILAGLNGLPSQELRVLQQKIDTIIGTRFSQKIK